MKKNVKRKESILSIREKKLAYSLILPTIILVLSIVIIPLLANFWISFKPISLGDLRPPKLILKESVRSKLSTTNDFATIQYRYRNSSSKYELNEVAFSDLIPKGIIVTKIKSQHGCKIEKNKLVCKLGKIKPKAFGKIILTITKNEFWNDNDNPKSEIPKATYKSTNILTSLEFTFENFKKIFSANEFWNVLKVSIYYTFFGTAGALLIGLFTAQIVNKSFKGRSFIRGLLLFPYVSPVIAVAFSWVLLFDPYSGIVNSLFIQMEVIEKPINFFGQKYTPINVFGF